MGTSRAILYSQQLVYLISCTADTQGKPTPLTFVGLPSSLRFSPLCKKMTQDEPAPVSKGPSQTQVRWEKQTLPSGRQNKEVPLPTPSHRLNNLHSPAQCPQQTAVRPCLHALRAAAARSASWQLLCNEQSSLNHWAASLCQGYSTDPEQYPAPKGRSTVVSGAF